MRAETSPTTPRLRRRVAFGLAASVLTVVALVIALAPGADAGGVGPDVTVYDLNFVSNWGAVSGVRAYSVATRSCNQGDTPLNWCDEPACAVGGVTTADHPVIAQNLYRLSNGRFQQIGMSWLKHGFEALQEAGAGCGDGTCQATGPDTLGVGCTDPYNAFLNGDRPLGQRSEVHAGTGDFPFPYSVVGHGNLTDQRLRVLESDLDPALNPGARYFVEGHYVAPDDAAAGNGLNNAAYREVSVNATSFNLSVGAPTVREQPAIAAWQAVDPLVELVAVDLPSTPVERFHVARKVTDLGGGSFHYEYAVHNLNSDRSARSLSIGFPGATVISGAGFHDVEHHSGEPYATDDWTIDTSTPNAISWSTDPFATDPNANALRWGTMFSFWFDATSPPAGMVHTLGLFKPGSPAEIEFSPSADIFEDGFESGGTGAWSSTIP